MKVKLHKKFDGQKLKEIYTKNGITQKQLAESCGLGMSTLQRYIQYDEAPVTVVKLICLTLGIEESELDFKQEAKKTPSDVLNESKTMDEIAKLSNEFVKLNKRLDSMENDLHTMVRAIIECTKTSNEAKAQVDLNREQIEAVFNKCTDISSNVAKCYGILNGRKKY